ncbi:MAG: hypothetical protein JWO73_156 [Candidatus Taylorbacteria bacterium]|nr:hypothetical protein [Candidatus Taylorbacteria bacterium]
MSAAASVFHNMDTNKLQNPDQAKEHADNLQTQIDQLHGQAQNASGDEKQGLLSKIENLKKEKDQVMGKIKDLEAEAKGMRDAAEGFLGKK